ncbi:MAG: TRL-like family protein [Deltaproteobacteria bacterium]|nr:TRL-like family protein [Deltaproteobacteria bacterium]
MLRQWALLVALLFVVAISAMACAYAQSPVTGFVYGNVQGPLTVTDLENASKKGMGTCKSVLGIISWGDCSIEAAAQQGGITKVRHVDFDSLNVIFVYAAYTTIVYGE